MSSCWSNYKSDFHDELLDTDGKPRLAATALFNYLDNLSNEDLVARKQAADLAIRQMGITFSVYSEGTNIDREWPFDIVPRIIQSDEWEQVHKGLEQRLKALNLFIDDLYHQQQIVKDGIVPAALFSSSQNF